MSAMSAASGVNPAVPMQPSGEPTGLSSQQAEKTHATTDTLKTQLNADKSNKAGEIFGVIKNVLRVLGVAAIILGGLAACAALGLALGPLGVIPALFVGFAAGTLAVKFWDATKPSSSETMPQKATELGGGSLRLQDIIKPDDAASKSVASGTAVVGTEPLPDAEDAKIAGTARKTQEKLRLKTNKELTDALNDLREIAKKSKEIPQTRSNVKIFDEMHIQENEIALKLGLGKSMSYEFMKSLASHIEAELKRRE